jgi:hypothetical protein
MRVYNLRPITPYLDENLTSPSNTLSIHDQISRLKNSFHCQSEEMPNFAPRAPFVVEQKVNILPPKQGSPGPIPIINRFQELAYVYVLSSYTGASLAESSVSQSVCSLGSHDPLMDYAMLLNIHRTDVHFRSMGSPCVVPRNQIIFDLGMPFPALPLTRHIAMPASTPAFPLSL